MDGPIALSGGVSEQRVHGHGWNRDLGPVGASERQRLGRVRVERIRPGRLEVDGVGQGDAGVGGDVGRLQDLGDATLRPFARPLVDDLPGRLGVLYVIEKPDAGAELGAQGIEEGLLEGHALLREDGVGDIKLLNRCLAGFVRSGIRIIRLEVRIVVGGLGLQFLDQGHDLARLPGRAEVVENLVHLGCGLTASPGADHGQGEGDARRGSAQVAARVELAEQVHSEVVDLTAGQCAIVVGRGRQRGRAHGSREFWRRGPRGAWRGLERRRWRGLECRPRRRA